jgi:hypothetical protein
MPATYDTSNVIVVCLLLQEYLGLVSTFKRQEALLYQFSEEKVQLAQHALELITNHQRELDAVRRLARCRLHGSLDSSSSSSRKAVRFGGAAGSASLSRRTFSERAGSCALTQAAAAAAAGTTHSRLGISSRDNTSDGLGRST